MNDLPNPPYDTRKHVILWGRMYGKTLRMHELIRKHIEEMRLKPVILLCHPEHILPDLGDMNVKVERSPRLPKGVLYLMFDDEGGVRLDNSERES